MTGEGKSRARSRVTIPLRMTIVEQSNDGKYAVREQIAFSRAFEEAMK